MDTTAELFEVAEHPKAGVIRTVQSVLDELQRLNKRHGGLLTQSQIAVLTGLSTPRVAELLAAGTFRRIELNAPDGDLLGIFVPVPDVVEWLKSNPRPGRRPSKAKFFLAAASTK